MMKPTFRARLEQLDYALGFSKGTLEGHDVLGMIRETSGKKATSFPRFLRRIYDEVCTDGTWEYESVVTPERSMMWTTIGHRIRFALGVMSARISTKQTHYCWYGVLDRSLGFVDGTLEKHGVSYKIGAAGKNETPVELDVILDAIQKGPVVSSDEEGVVVSDGTRSMSWANIGRYIGFYYRLMDTERQIDPNFVRIP